MSATLRVTDFTENPRLFAEYRNNLPVLRVPGRTHPVSIHHAKDTELEDYVGEAVKKTCKIHRKLPEGGVLVFLTGRDEILYAVKRLRKILTPKKRRELRPLEKLEEKAAEAAGEEVRSGAPHTTPPMFLTS